MISKPTRVTAECATLIDNIWTNEVEFNVKNTIIYADITDHFPVVSHFSYNRNYTCKKEIIYKRNFSETNMEIFLNLIMNLDWSEVYEYRCASKAFDTFASKFTKLFNECFPIKKFHVGKKDMISPHITLGLKTSIKERKRLERLSIKWPLSYREKYRTYRNKLTKLLKLAKDNYYKDSLRNNQGNAKETWKIINSILGKQTISQSNAIDIDCGPVSIPDAFNQHFVGVGGGGPGGSTAATTAVPRHAHRRYLTNTPNTSFYLTPTTEQEIKQILNNVKCTAAGIDEIPPKLLKLTSNAIASPLSHLINLAFTQGVFPNKLKIAKVIPIYKKGDKRDVRNYRQVSVLPAFSKIYEKALTYRFTQYLENNNILSDYQHGFRQNRSTETALTQFASHVYKCLDTKLHAAGVFLDLSRAFDSLDHDILLDKLNHVGIRGLPLQLFKSYLNNRVQTVFCNNNYSSMCNIRQGVPQGSILGPIMFLLYINDIVNVSDNCKYVIFADDTTLIFIDKSIQSLQNKLHQGIKLIKQWITYNKLLLNISKTNLVYFKSRSDSSELPPVVVDNENIEQVKHTKFLGVMVDEHLNWKQQINSVTLKLSKASGILHRIRHQLTQKAMMNVYYTLCYPYLIYCASVWGCTWPTFLNEVIVAQKRLIRIMCFKGKYDHTSDLFTELHLLNFLSIHKYFLLLAVFKSLHNTQVVDNNLRLFARTAHVHDTRGSLTDLVCPPVRTTLCLNSVLCAGPRMWNSLPQILKNINQLNTFKKHLKEFLLTTQYGHNDA